MFKLPLEDNLVSGALCNIRGESQSAEFIRTCDLIIWDELPMTHKYCVEALNKSLQDLLNNNTLFGGKTFLFSGDWRQIGPVVKYGSASDTVEAAVIASFPWSNITRLRLTASQRDKENKQYASFVRAVVEGRQPTVHMPNGDMVAFSNTNDTSTSEHYNLKFNTNFDDLVNFVHPNLNEETDLMHDRAILATSITAIDAANKEIAKRRLQNPVSFSSFDSLISDDSNPNTAFAAPEHLNLLDVQGVPPHELVLRSNDLALLTRNLNFGEGLVNGQKCVVLDVSPNPCIIQIQLLSSLRPICPRATNSLPRPSWPTGYQVQSCTIPSPARILPDNKQIPRTNIISHWVRFAKRHLRSWPAIRCP